MITTYLQSIPMVAILRGLHPEHASKIATALYKSGLRAIEVPMNSPRPIESIQNIRNALPDDCAVGAGTVTSIEECNAVLATGSTLIVSPHTNPHLIEHTINKGGISLPGAFTPTEVFQAIEAGASGIKLFPASSGGITHYRAIKAVIPSGMPVIAVGGINANNINAWLSAGVTGVGVGSAVFKPSWQATDVHEATKSLVSVILEQS